MIRKLFNNMTVKSRISAVLIIVMVVATTAVVSVRANQVRAQMNMLLEERLKGNANMTFGIFDTVMLYTMRMLDSAATHARLGFTDAGYDMEMQLVNMFVSMSHETDGVRSYENIAAFDSDFNMVAVANPGGDLPDMGMFPEYLDKRMAAPWISPVFESAASGRLQFMFSKPVMDGDDFLGMVAITSNTEMLAYFLRDFVQAYDSFVNIADRSGVIFFSTRPEAYMGRHVNDLGVIEAFGEIPMNTVFEHNSALTGIDKIAYVTHDPYLDWSIVSFFDAHAVENVNWIIFTSLLPTVSGILIAAFLIVLILYRSLKPLQTLALGAKEVSKGNISVPFLVKRNDEIAQVANAFTEIVRALNILRDNFKKAEDAMTRGGTEFTLGDSRLGGIYGEMLTSTSTIVGHMKQSMIHAEAASKTKSEFLSKMSHEIRTPMNAILGMAELMLREDLSDAVRDQAMTIRQSGDHLLSIINDILDLSKVESGKLELVNTAYLFHSTINDVVSIIKMRMTNPNLRFAVYMQHDIPNDLFGDEVRLRQILLNVLSNALKYTNEGYFSLEVTGEKAGDGETIMLTMTIEDTGIGIKPEDMKKLFSEFAQFDLEKNRNVEGTGLGLAITHNLIKLMGGEVKVSSEYGKGSKFVIHMPQKLHRQHEDSDSNAWPPSFGDKTALLYGNTAIYTEYAARTLKDLKVAYHVVSDDSELHNKLLEEKWGYVFAEEGLAHTALHIVKTRELDTKVVMMSDSYETKGDPDIAVLIMPAYFLSVVNALTGRDASYSLNNQQMEHFIAPDAKILLVDDISTNLKVGQGLLKQYCVGLDMCTSGKEAIEAVVAGDYDLVLMDHMMPEMDGVEAVKIIRGFAATIGEKYANLPIVALTANAIVGAREMFLQNGFNDFLSKPIETSKLNSILAKWIPKEKQQQANFDPGDAAEETPITINIDDVDTAKGISFSGGSAKNYLETLAIFHKDGLRKMDELLRCLESDNLSLYTTYVHALKSACANIGATRLSEEAKILEAAGIKKDLDFIMKNNPGFMDGLEKLLADIGDAISANTEKSDGSDFDGEALKSLLAELKAALENFDMAAIDEASEKLQGFTKFSDVGEALGNILQDAFVGNYKQAGTRIEELLASFG